MALMSLRMGSGFSSSEWTRSQAISWWSRTSASPLHDCARDAWAVTSAPCLQAVGICRALKPGMHPSRSPIHIALALVATSLIAPARPVAAQGGPKTTRAAGATPSTDADQPSLQPARSVLRQLVGRWRFATWFAGNFDGPPDATGTRVVAALYDDLRLEWTATHDDP